MAEFDVTQLTFERQERGLLIRHDGLPINIIDGAVTAQRFDEHGGYHFFDEEGQLLAFITDAFLRRMYRDKESAPRQLRKILDLAAALQRTT